MSIVPTTLDVPKNPAERRVWVCYQLRLRGDSLRAIARRIGVCQQAPSNALMNPSKDIEQAIAEAIGLTPEQLFPERFDATGKRLVRTRSPQRNTRPAGRNIQEECAA